MKTLIATLFLIISSSSLLIAQNSNVPTVGYKGKPIVQMTLNGKKTWVLLDTGSDISILNIRYKDRYNFHAARKFNNEIKASGLGSTNNTLYEVSGAQLYFGNVKLKSLFYAYDFSNVASSIRAKTGKTITAIIGTDLMQSYRFVIDLGNHKVSMMYKVKKRNKKDLKLAEEEPVIARVD